MSILQNKKIAIVADWLTNQGGGEKVLETISELFPNAPIYTTVVDVENIGHLAQKKIHTSFLQYFPYSHKHTWWLPFLPRAIESLKVQDYDIIISLSSCVAKSVKTTKDQLHICYMHSPMRYAWEMNTDPRWKSFPRILQPFIKAYLKYLRRWDRRTSKNPDVIIANSHATAKRITKYYNRESEVLFPPVDQKKSKFSAAPRDGKKSYFLALGRLVAYKKFDLIVKAFAKIPHERLIIAGSGNCLKTIKKIIQKQRIKNVELLGKVNDRQKWRLLAGAKALLHPQIEDAGITQLEAMSCGTPVIAFEAGGSLDVIKSGINGILFHPQEATSIQRAIQRFSRKNWKPKSICKSVAKFDTPIFQKSFLKILEKAYKKHSQAK